MAQEPYGTPRSLQAELGEFEDLTFASDTAAWEDDAPTSNRVFAPSARRAPVPAIVLLPTCAGQRLHLREWAKAALGLGYAVLFVDGLRGLSTDCGSPSKIPNGRLVKDGLDAVAHLGSLPIVDAERICVLGFSKGGLVATWMASPSVREAVRPGTPGIEAVASVYGFCSLPPTPGRPTGVRILQADTDRPLLMLMGGSDRVTPPGSCLKLLPAMRAEGAPVEWHVYPEATHQWDQRDSHGLSRTVYHGEPVTYLYDEAATQDSRRRVFDFFARRAAQ